MKVKISLFSNGVEHAYKYELDLEEDQGLPQVVSPCNDVNRVFVNDGIEAFSLKTSYHEATYGFCTMIRESPDPVRIAEANAPLLGDRVPTWSESDKQIREYVEQGKIPVWTPPEE